MSGLFCGLIGNAANWRIGADPSLNPKLTLKRLLLLISMDQALALEIMLAGNSVLLTGPAGSGKTYLLNEFIRHAKREKRVVAITATTGLAATHLGGNTIHAWSGIGVRDELPRDFLKYLSKSRQDNIAKVQTLIIDEVSMLHDYRLNMVDEVLRKVRGSDEPFGGLQVILCGDFFQLPPVNRTSSIASNFVVNSRAWRELNPVICYLTEQHRQDDDILLGILNAIRQQDIRRRHIDSLLARIQQKHEDQEAAQLHTTNIDVDSINAVRLESLNSDAHIYSMQTTGKASYVEQLKRSCLAQETLILKEGALVMCIRNSQDKRYVNGSLGIVAGFDEDSGYPSVKLKNGREITLTPETWELRDGDKKRASLTQIPLRLAWAITVHKSQGMTLDGARIDLRKAFVEGMGYVALSRVRRLEDLSLAGINKISLQVSPDALKIDGELRLRSKEDAERLAHLRARAKKRKSFATEKNPKPGTWTEKLAKMREQYANAYKPWSKEDETLLLGLFQKGAGLKELCARFARHPGSIRSRIRKHLGEDITIPK